MTREISIGVKTAEHLHDASERFDFRPDRIEIRPSRSSLMRDLAAGRRRGEADDVVVEITGARRLVNGRYGRTRGSNWVRLIPDGEGALVYDLAGGSMDAGAWLLEAVTTALTSSVRAGAS